MTVAQVAGLIKKATEDADFRTALEAVPIEQRRAILAGTAFSATVTAAVAAAA